jgi:asparagine synthase (glutamine-hydrolysing)
MCGILVGFGQDVVSPKYTKLNNGLSKLDHRGPDNKSYFTEHKVYLGHTRLSIIDTGASANQPYRYGHLIMVYNGEVFNYLELRQILEERGYTFETHSDTEVIIKSFHCFGTDCFAQFNGMWALAIYDLEKKELIVSRDRFGQKPLFITRHQETIYAASEPQALTEIVPVKPNFAAIASFLKEADFNVGGNTFFQDIFEFPVASYLRISSDGSMNTHAYWSYPDKIVQPDITTGEFHSLLEDAVALRLRSDVDYSLLLSGGCDSTLIAGITRKLIGDRVSLSAFNYASRDEYDESRFAQEVADKLNIDLFICEQEKSTEAFIQTLKILVRHLGRGHGSPAIMSVNYLYKVLSQQGFKVTLDGQGADELLAGYSHYHFHLLLELIGQKEGHQIIEAIKDLKRIGFRKVLPLSLRLSLPPFWKQLLRRVYGYEHFFSQKSVLKLQEPLLKEVISVPKNQSPLNKYLITQHISGLKNLLYYGDIVAMVNSVENRSPFMDYRLVDAVFSGSFRLKVENGRNKAVLKKHPVYIKFYDILEREKIGFASYLSTSIKEKFIEDLQESSILDWPIFNKKALLLFLSNKKLALSKKYEPFLFRIYQIHLWTLEFLPATFEKNT